MQKPYEVEADVQLNKKARIVIVHSQWHAEITGVMLTHCQSLLLKAGVEDVTVVEVPGALEIPLIAKKVAKEQKPAAIICIGAIVRGETLHFELVASEVSQGMSRVAYDFEMPVIQQVLAVENLEQLKARSSDDEFNKGIEAAQAAIAMIDLMDGFSS